MTEEIKKEESSLNEASIGRLKQHIDKGDVFVAVSAFRGNYTRSENLKRQARLRSLVDSHTLTQSNEKKIGHFDVIGGYEEEDEKTGKKRKVEEIATFIVGSKEQEKTIKNLGLALGKEFDQDSILFCHDGKVYEVFTRKTSEHNVGDENYLGTYHYNTVSKYYSKIRGKTFVAESVQEELQYCKPSSFFDGMAKQSHSLHFKETGEFSESVLHPRNVISEEDEKEIERFTEYMKRNPQLMDASSKRV